MSDGYIGWFDGWQNARQRRAIEDLHGQLGSLGSSLARQRQESSRLRSQLSQLQGTLEQRVARLTRSLEALVELSDVRQVLAMYDPPALVRHQARVAITDLPEAVLPEAVLPEAVLPEAVLPEAVLPEAVLPEVEPPTQDVPGYWLGPAVRALVTLVRGAGTGTGTGDALAIAERCDRTRTGLLLACGLAVAGRGELAAPWLPEAIGRLIPGTPMTVAQRTLWIAAAAGVFGAAGTVALRQRLAQLVGGLTPEQEQAEAAAWAGAVRALRTAPMQLPEAVRGDDRLRRGLAAGGTLAALRQLCDPDEAAAALDGSTVDQLTEVLHWLVDEGTPEEAPLLRRAAQLRAAIESGAEPAEVSGWDDEAGDPLELLRADAFAADRPGVTLARQAGSRWLLAAAIPLAEATAITPPPAVTVKVAGCEIRVAPTGPDDWDLSRARTQLEERPVVDAAADKITKVVAVAGGVLCLPVVAWPHGLAVLSVLAGAGLLVWAVVRWFREREARAVRVTQREADLARLERQLTQSATELAEVHRWQAEAAERATADLAAIRTRLTGAADPVDRPRVEAAGGG